MGNLRSRSRQNHLRIRRNNRAKKHHEDSSSFRKNFIKDVQNVYEKLQCNPFQLVELTMVKFQENAHLQTGLQNNTETHRYPLVRQFTGNFKKFVSNRSARTFIFISDFRLHYYFLSTTFLSIKTYTGVIYKNLSYMNHQPRFLGDIFGENRPRLGND